MPLYDLKKSKFSQKVSKITKPAETLKQSKAKSVFSASQKTSKKAKQSRFQNPQISAKIKAKQSKVARSKMASLVATYVGVLRNRRQENAKQDPKMAIMGLLSVDIVKKPGWAAPRSFDLLYLANDSSNTLTWMV